MWHHTFQIPDRGAFSGSVQQAIDTGVVSAKARREINQTLRTLSLQGKFNHHTMQNFASYLSIGGNNMPLLAYLSFLQLYKV